MSLSYLRACVNMSGYEISGIVPLYRTESRRACVHRLDADKFSRAAYTIFTNPGATKVLVKMATTYSRTCNRSNRTIVQLTWCT